MGRSEYDPGVRGARAWNAGKLVGAKRALKPEQVWAIRFMLDREQRVRDRALFDLAIDSKLRACDVVKIRIGELVSGERLRSRAIVVQRKTGRPVQFEILEPARTSLLAWLDGRGARSTTSPSRAASITLRTAAPGNMRAWSMSGSKLRPTVGRLRHALASAHEGIVYKRTGNLRAVQILLGHTKTESTVRYLGVDIDDALVLAEGTEL